MINNEILMLLEQGGIIDVIPKKLYRYRQGTEYDIKNLKDKQIWLSNAKEFNDPFDSILFDGPDNININLQDISYSASFTESNTDICMWSHYANYHKGFCLEYNMPIMSCIPVYYAKRHEKINKYLFPIFVKANIWKYEQEWRFVDPDSVDSNRGSKGYLIGSPDVTAIYMGVRSHENRAMYEQLKEIAKNQGLKFYEMKPSENEYAIFPKEIKI